MHQRREVVLELELQRGISKAKRCDRTQVDVADLAGIEQQCRLLVFGLVRAARLAPPVLSSAS